MPTRRDFILTGVMLAVAKAPAWGINFDNAPQRYRNWLVQFQRDLAQFSANTAEKSGISEEGVGEKCKSSIVPHSRADLLVREWLTDAADKHSAHHGTGRYADLSSVSLLLFEHSVPAGYGGLFHESHGSRFPSGRFSVWYMHIGGPASLQTYFDDKAQFPHYQLPPNGMLKRRAYPFLLFDDVGETLRLAGVGAEWMGAAVYLHRKQYS